MCPSAQDLTSPRTPHLPAHDTSEHARHFGSPLTDPPGAANRARTDSRALASLLRLGGTVYGRSSPGVLTLTPSRACPPPPPTPPSTLSHTHTHTSYPHPAPLSLTTSPQSLTARCEHQNRNVLLLHEGLLPGPNVLGHRVPQSSLWSSPSLVLRPAASTETTVCRRRGWEVRARPL